MYHRSFTGSLPTYMAKESVHHRFGVLDRALSKDSSDIRFLATRFLRWVNPEARMGVIHIPQEC